MQQISSTTKNILSAIEDQRVKPRSRWYFIARNSVLWLPGIVTTLLGGYTIAGVLYGIVHVQLVQGTLTETGSIPVFMSAGIPILWVISFGIFSIVTISLLRRTYDGYRHTSLQLLTVSVASSVVIGILFYAVTQNATDNLPKTYYRYPTQHSQEYYERFFQAERMN